MPPEAHTHPLLSDSEGKRFELRPWRCPICGQSEERLIGLRGGKHQRYGQGVVNQIVQCKSCSLLYPNPFPIPLDPQLMYGDPEKYFTGHDETGKVSRSRDLIRQYAEKLGRTNFRLLDIGSGRGELPEAARLEGVEAVGLEFSQAMIDYTRTKYGITLLAKSVEELANESSQRFDAFSLNAVLEHVYDPDAMIAAVSRLAAPGAVIYIDVPNEPNAMTRVGNLVHRLMRNPAVYNLSPSWPPYHVYGFNPKAMRTLLKKHGFELTGLKIFSSPRIPSRPEIKDRVKALAAAQVMRIGNLTGTATNMFVWARKRD